MALLSKPTAFPSALWLIYPRYLAVTVPHSDQRGVPFTAEDYRGLILIAIMAAGGTATVDQPGVWP